MIAPAQPAAPTFAAVLDDQYLASFGKSGGLGCFTAPDEAEFARGDRVVLQTPRGLEVGAILSRATVRQARLVGAQTSGTIIRRIESDDANLLAELRDRAENLFAASRQLAAELRVAVQVLDVEVLLDGSLGIVQVVAAPGIDLDPFAEALQQRTQLAIRLENLAVAGTEEEESHEGGCGKPDCGKTEGGGCSSCGTGGCGSCGEATDLTPYFAHLRTRMDDSTRTPLL